MPRSRAPPAPSSTSATGAWTRWSPPREAFEIATRFFFGNVRARLRLVEARIERGKDLFGKSEFMFGVSIKPRRVDFDLFHQSAEAENCYGPFQTEDLSDPSVEFPWAGPGRLVWEGYLDVRSILRDQSLAVKDMVVRLDLYVGERDLLGIGFSDNVIFRKQYYVRAVLPPDLALFLHTNEDFATPADDAKRHGLRHEALSPIRAASTPFGWPMDRVDGGWEFGVEGTGFTGRLRIELDTVPEEGAPEPMSSARPADLASGPAEASPPSSPSSPSPSPAAAAAD